MTTPLEKLEAVLGKITPPELTELVNAMCVALAGEDDRG